MLFSKIKNIPLENLLNPVQYNAPINTPTTPIFDFSLTQQITELNLHLKTIGKIIFYITHPKQLLSILWYCSVEYSYLICLIICVAGVIMYILGHKKGAKWISGSIVSYSIIQAINSIF